MTRTANCACGNLTLSITGEAQIVAICSCKQCQLRTGSVYSSHAFFPQSEVVISGEHNTYTRSSDSGNDVSFHFCPNCGSNVFWKAHKRPESWGVALGSLSGPELSLPVAALYAEKKLDWVTFPDDVPVFEKEFIPSE